MLFRDRIEAGQLLANYLNVHVGGHDQAMVVGLPQGGMTVAFEVARSRQATLDALPMRVLGVPGHEDLSMGAVAPDGVVVLNQAIVDLLKIPEHVIDAAVQKEVWGLLEQTHQSPYQESQAPWTRVKDQAVIVVDDGLAGGAAMHAACECLKRRGARYVCVAVPTASQTTLEKIRKEVDDVVSLMTPEPFYGVGFWYRNYAPTSAREINALLAQSRHW